MTPTPFDDYAAFDRRWSDSDRRHALAEADPLLFVADHIPSRDRRAGSIALCILPIDGPSTLALIPDGPLIPSDTDCLMLLSRAAAGGNLRGLGVVHHRLGGPDVTDVDRRWALALKATSLALDFEPIGILARLHSGELVHVDVPDVLPAEYLSTIGP